MTLFLILFMFIVIMFMVCIDYMLSIIIMFMHKIVKHSLLCSNGVSGRHCVSVALIRCLPVDAPYIPDCMVDRKGDSLVESFIVHLPFVGQVGPDCYRSKALFLIFLSNVPYV
jgi:hypothetical protein